MVKRIILVVITFAMLVVLTGTIDCYSIKPKPAIEASLSEIATDYYENDFYSTILEIDTSTQPLSEILERYTKVGFSEFYLRQLLIYTGNNHTEATAILEKHCDKNRTYARFYPEPPYGRKNYRVEYVYSCDSK